MCTYWPEFGKNGKENIRLCDVLRHESGLAALGDTVKWEDFTRDAIRLNKV